MVPVYHLEPELKDSLSMFIKERKAVSGDSCFLLYLNTMDSSGSLLQITFVPQESCHLKAYDFQIDSTFGVSFIDSTIVLIYGRSTISNKLAFKSKSFCYVNVISLVNEDIEHADDFFPETKFINFSK
jgi:hypothetical protein